MFWRVRNGLQTTGFMHHLTGQTYKVLLKQKLQFGKNLHPLHSPSRSVPVSEVRNTVNMVIIIVVAF